MSTMTIVLIVLGLIALLCCGSCGGCMWFGASTATKMRDDVMRKVNANQAVKAELGEPLEAGFPSNVTSQNLQTSLDFPVTGPKGTATVHAEGVYGANGFEASVIQVKTSGGKTIDVNSADDPTNLDFGNIDMEETD
jgi:hypothetical protein